MRGKPYRIAIIAIDSVKRRSFGWLVTGGKPFAQFDPADIDDDLLNSVFDLYRHVYSQIDSNLFATQVSCKKYKSAVLERVSES